MPIEILSVMHVNVNCSDLQRSLAFYQSVAGLTAASHTNPVPQDGAGFGMVGEVQWDALILQDGRGFAGPSLDLLEWKHPPPIGRPYDDPVHLGLTEVCIESADLGAVFERARSAGAHALSEPFTGPTGGRRFYAADPDGTRLEFSENGGVDLCQLIGARIGCSDLARSVDWYQRVVGLEVRGELEEGRGLGSSGSGPCDGAHWSARSLWPPGQSAFGTHLVEWETAAGTPYTAANHLGIYRLAFMVADIHACHRVIESAGVECPPPVFLDMGPDIPIDGVWALFFPDPDGTCLELIQVPAS